MAGVAHALDLALEFYELLIFAWALGSWMPHWRYQEWYRTLNSIVQPYIAVFYPLRLNFGGIDLTPMVAFFAIELFRHALEYAVGLGGH